MFEVLETDGQARRGRLQLPHGSVETPVFQPCGTYGTVKGMTPVELTRCGTQMLLGNTFHLMQRPGDQQIRDLGGLHNFMGGLAPSSPTAVVSRFSVWGTCANLTNKALCSSRP